MAPRISRGLTVFGQKSFNFLLLDIFRGRQPCHLLWFFGGYPSYYINSRDFWGNSIPDIVESFWKLIFFTFKLDLSVRPGFLIWNLLCFEDRSFFVLLLALFWRHERLNKLCFEDNIFLHARNFLKTDRPTDQPTEGPSPRSDLSSLKNYNL